jgi:crotonobetainyl-CoA:carnitine CoA-transferase CaiB-like acyl-CoA transferase
VVELASDQAAFAGKLLADLGAEVIVVEPRDGHGSRAYEPYLDDEPGVERSLWWWHYNTSKLGVTLDIDDEADRDVLRRLVGTADVVLEGERPGRLSALGFDAPGAMAADERLIWCSVTAFGRDNPRRDEEFCDLTVLAGAGPVWHCGYDDHTLPPVRGGGNQGYHTGSVWAVIGILTAVLAREVTGAGQLIDVSLHAASNVTTEAGSYGFLVAEWNMMRQTCRHASMRKSAPVLALAGDGRYIHTGFAPRSGKEFRELIEWMGALGILDGYDDAAWLELGAERDYIAQGEIGTVPEVTEMFRAGREALSLIAASVDGEEFFVESQRRGLACGVIASPDEMMTNEHFVARGFPVPVHYDHVDRTVVHAGAPFDMNASPYRIRHRAPLLGEHNEQVLGPLSVDR